MRTTKSILFGTALVLAALTSDAQPFLTDGLVAHYPLNGNANNAFGTNNGTVVGAVTTTNRFGHPGSAYSFNGTSSRIEFTTPPLTQLDNWTVSAWVKPNNFTHEGIAVHVGLDNGGTGDGYGFGLHNSAALEMLSPATGWRSSGQALPGTSQWSHIVMTRSGGLAFYVNGVQSLNNTATSYLTPSDFTIGSQNGLRFFNGQIDDVRIYNRPLASNEVTQLFAYNEICTPHAAQATPVMFNGFVIGATITDSGCGYTSAPPVTITGGGGSNATATATISGGLVTSITIQNPGCCYTNPPLIVVGSPPFVPTVSIAVSKVKVTQHVMVGRNYVLEASTDLVTWSPTGPPFSPASETIVTELDSDLGGRYFRLREVP
jgi:hypothetical protein